MILSVKFDNYRNLDGEYVFSNIINDRNVSNNIDVIVGRNHTGKTNILEGIRLAFSAINDDYVRIKKSDFKNSEDSVPINITVMLEPGSIPTLDYFGDKYEKCCGFNVNIYKTTSGRYVKKITQANGMQIDNDILRNDNAIPEICVIPLQRIEDIYSTSLNTGMSKFINSEEAYNLIKSQSKAMMKEQIKDNITKFQDFCSKFIENIDVEFTDPKISDEKLYIVDGEKEHNAMMGSGYKSIANLFLNILSGSNSIMLIDEIENHLHPSLLRMLIKDLRNAENVKVICTTHSPIVVNELELKELIDVNGVKLSNLDEKNKNTIDIFMHPGRAEMILSENIILVEGYTEELLLNNYIRKKLLNWTIVNVAGVMFEPYVKLASLLKKNIVVISDSDLVKNEGQPTTRFNNLKKLCVENNFKIIEVFNTLESDLYKNEFLTDDYNNYFKDFDNIYNVKVCKDKQKVPLATKMIEDDIDLSEWHVIVSIHDVFK